MAVLVMNGIKVPVAVNLIIMAGRNPIGVIKVTNGSREFSLVLEPEELKGVKDGLTDTTKGTKIDADTLSEFMQKEGL